jgi:hypothetical protein
VVWYPPPLISSVAPLRHSVMTERCNRNVTVNGAWYSKGSGREKPARIVDPQQL